MDEDVKQWAPSLFRRRSPFHKDSVEPDDVKPSPPALCTIYTAGQCDHARGPGGWAYVALIDGAMQEESGEEVWMTPLGIDLLAAIRGLSVSPPESTVQLITNSQTVQHAMATRGGSPPVRRGQLIEDGELWEHLAELAAQRQVDWAWLRVYAAKATRDHYHSRVLQLAHTAGRRAARHASEGMVDGSAGEDTRSTAVGLPSYSADPPPMPRAREGTAERSAERSADVAVASGLSGRSQSPAADTTPPSSVEERRHMSTNDMAHSEAAGVAGVAGVADVVSTAPVREPVAAPAGDQEMTRGDEQRRLLIAECWSLEQRWAEIRAQVVDLDAEWRHLVGQLKDGEDAAQRTRPLDWADGVLVFRDLGQHAARLSGLTEEALHTCKQYALALQRAMEGLEV